MATKKATENKQIKMHFASKDQHVKKLGLYYVPFTQLKILPNLNDREDYGSTEDMQELAKSIYEFGPRIPIKGYKDGDHYVVVQGHRRFRAAEMIYKKHGEDVVFPLMVYAPGTHKTDYLLDTLLTNNGKDLTVLEKAKTVSRLVEESVGTKDIASYMGGVSEVYVKNLARLWTIPENAKKLIRDGVVAATLIMGVLKNKNANLEEFIQEVEKQANSADQSEGDKKPGKKKTAKVTAKNAPGKKDKINSLAEFKRFRKSHEGTFENKAKQAAYEFMSNVVDGGVSYLEIVEFFTGK
jgi:ParB/RepB/Spo0J family partition protein